MVFMKKKTSLNSKTYNYIPSDEYIDFNAEDPDLDTIRVELPKQPAFEDIIGYGLDPKDQKFQRVEVPYKLVELMEIQHEEGPDKGKFLTQDEIWTIINKDQDYYKREIQFMRREWRRVLEGIWIFINGKATYIDGWHYFYLTYYKLDDGYPKYRDRDRRFFHFARFCKNDPYCFGFLYPKHRREGATYKTSCIHYLEIISKPQVRGGIQSMTDDSAEDVFLKHIVDPWITMPFFFKPNHNGGDDPKAMLKFRSPASRGKAGIKAKSTKALRSEISFRSSKPLAYDGTKLFFYHHEEVGKAINVDIVKRWQVVKRTLSTGADKNIHGFSIHTSTVGEMEVGGGGQFRKLCDGSHYSKRNKNNQTKSGLYILFMPAWDGLEGFIDEFGNSVIDDPTPEQKAQGIEVGAKEHIQNVIDSYKDAEDKTDLLQFQREHPTSFKGCFRSNAKDPFFDIPLIEDRLDELRDDRTAVTRGYFEWMGKPYASGVRFIPDENGRFKLSKQLFDMANRIHFDSMLNTFIADNYQFCAGADPFKANKVKGKGSKGGGAVFWGHDIMLDPLEKPLAEWQSCRFVCTYSYKPPTKEEYGDDMLMMCIYFGCPMHAETNVPFVREWFEQKGYGGLLLRIKGENGKHDQLAGSYTDISLQQKIFHWYRSHVRKHVIREKHADLLEELVAIQGVDEMTFYDLFTAGGFAGVGIENYLPSVHQRQQQQSKISDTFVEEIDY